MSRREGWIQNRTLACPLSVNSSRRKVCRAEVRAPVSILALIAGILSSGSATQSAKVQLKTMLRLQEGLSYQLNRTQLGTTKSE